MGHRLLGQLPATRNWQKVVELLNRTDAPAKIADATSEAAKRGLELAARDYGVADVVYVLMTVVWAACRKDSFKKDVAKLGLSLRNNSSLLDIVGEFDHAIDARLRRQGHRTDLAEMARFAAVDALTEASGHKTDSLFGASLDDTRESLKSFATKARFGAIGQRFFGRFLYRFLDYHLSRELPNHIGPDKQWGSVNACAQFKDALALHCHENARIVKDFIGCWPSAKEFKEGITAENVRQQFVPVAIKKVQSELSRREMAHA